MAAPRFILAADRWGDRITVVDLTKASDPACDGTSAAVVARLRCTPDIDEDGDGAPDAPGSGQPVAIVKDPFSNGVVIVNHSGAASARDTRRFQHGHPGALAFLDIDRALENAGDPLAGLIAFVPTGTAGPVGCALAPRGRHLLISSAEAEGSEDGGRHITLFDLETRSVLRQVAQALAPGAPLDARPSPHPGPHESFGIFPCPNGVAVSARGYAFAGNGGTDDVSMFDLAKMLAGDPRSEIARIPVASGPFGLAVSPDGRWLAVANRESARTGAESNVVSLVNIDEAAVRGDACRAPSILVGTDEPSRLSRPFAAAFTPDGALLLATCFRTDSLALTDVAAARTESSGAVTNIRLLAPDGGPARPRGVAVLPDGATAAIVGGAKGHAGVLWLLDLSSGRVLSRVTGVGDECYAVAAF